MSTVNILIKNTSVLLLSTAFQKLTGVITIILLARYLGTEDFGRYSYLMVFVLMVDTIMCQGLDVLLVREIAKDRTHSDNIFKNVLFLKIFLVPVYLIVTFGLLKFMTMSQQLKHLIMLLAVFHIFYSIQKTICSLFNAHEQLKFVAILDCVFSALKTIFIIAGIILVLKLKYIVIGISVSYFSVFMIANAICWAKFSSFSFEFDLKWIKEHMSSSLWFVLYVIIFGFYWKSDQFVISHILPYEKVGIYSAAFLFVDLSIAVSAAYFSSVYPLISRLYPLNYNHFELLRDKSYKYLMIIGVPIPFMGLFIVDKLIQYIYGVDFLETALIVKIFLFAIPVIFIRSFLLRIVFSSGKEKPMFFVTIIIVSTKILLLCFLLGYFGIIAAALIMVCVEILYVYLMVVLCAFPRDFVFNKLLTYTYKPFVSTGAMVVCLYFFRNSNIYFLALSGALVYLVGLFLYKVVGKSEYVLLSNSFKSLLMGNK